MKLSIIVPVYNVEKYVARCLDSLLNQGLSEDDYEIICVNDGSTDHSLQICQQYESEHKNIHVYSQENQGVSAARNFGLEKASAEAVCFADSDDTIVPGGLSIALKYYSDNDIDLVRYWCRFIVKGTECAKPPFEEKAYFEGDGFGFIAKHGFCTFAYCYIIRKDFLLHHNITFKSIKMAEDLLFVETLLLHNPRMIAISLPIYNYHINPSSATTTRTPTHSQACVNAFITALDEIKNMASKISDTAVQAKSKTEISSRVVPIVSRMMTSNYKKAEFYIVVSKLKDLDILPVSKKNGISSSKLQILINTVTSSYMAYKAASFLYSHIFAPYILPKLDRNK